MNILSRRRFAAGMIAGAAAWRAKGAEGWSRLEGILGRIEAPKFPERVFDVTRYGAEPDGKDSTEAFGKAIAACAAAGGGRVLVPRGAFQTGPIYLKSNVELHVSTGATLRFTRDPRAYLPVVFTRWEGVECMNYSPFVYAFGERNIAITGGGVLDGQADCEHWWPWKGRTNCGWKKGDPQQAAARDRLMAMAEKDVPVEERRFGDGSYLRPQFIQPYRCANVLVEGVRIVNSPMWEINPVLCRNVIVRGVKISSHGPNNDGCNPECSTDVLIRDCEFDTGDDCIAIKSGRNRDGRRVAKASESIVIQGCVIKDGHGGVTIGSEISGDVRWVFAERCRMDSPNLDRALRIKTNAVRGGVLEHIYLRDIEVGQVSGAAIEIDFNYEEGNAGSFKPVVRDIEVRELRCRKSERALSLVGYADAPIQDVRLVNCRFEEARKGNRVEHVTGLSFENVQINGKPTRAE